MPRIIVGMITRNSLSKGERGLLDVLSSIAREIPYDVFILGDAGSTDGTVSLVEYFNENLGKKLVLVDGGRTRAIGRQKVIEEFLMLDADWLLFVDDDAVLRTGWFAEAEQYINMPRVGLIWGIDWNPINERRLWISSLGLDYTDYSIREFWRRGGMHDTLLRKEAISDIKIPPFLHVYEDYWILKHIRDKGYEIKIIKSGVLHSNPGNVAISDLRMMAKIAKSIGLEHASVLALCKTFVGLPMNIWASVKGKLGVKRPRSLEV